MNISLRGLRFIAEFEGFSATLYDDPAGHCTIGFGHLVHRGPTNGDPSEVRFANALTREDALVFLQRDALWAATAVNELVIFPLTQNQFDAMVSLVYNVGSGNFKRSGILRALNARRVHEIPNRLLSYVYAGGVALPGLIRRRTREGLLFSKGEYDHEPPQA